MMFLIIFVSLNGVFAPRHKDVPSSSSGKSMRGLDFRTSEYKMLLFKTLHEMSILYRRFSSTSVAQSYEVQQRNISTISTFYLWG